MSNLGTRVVAAMSGGVDSSVAAALLCQRGYAVTGVTMRLPRYGAPGDGRSCCGIEAADDARRVAAELGIRHYVLDFRNEFEQTVIDDFCSAYAAGRTPNPCARCNERLKFGGLLERARAFGADFVATGHYVRKVRDPASHRMGLERGPAGDDQSYFLYGLTQKQLHHALFPLADMSKDEVRGMASRLGLRVHDKPDSQDLCFLGRGDYREFLRQRCPRAFEPGPVQHVSGRHMGEHEGIGSFTVGQRRGLGIAHTQPLYVIGFRPDEKAVVVGEREHLLRQQFTVGAVNWLSPAQTTLPRQAEVKIRFNHRGVAALLCPLPGGRVRVEAARPVSAPAPGQSAVFYQGQTVLGGGIIEPATSLDAPTGNLQSGTQEPITKQPAAPAAEE